MSIEIPPPTPLLQVWYPRHHLCFFHKLPSCLITPQALLSRVAILTCYGMDVCRSLGGTRMAIRGVSECTETRMGADGRESWRASAAEWHVRWDCHGHLGCCPSLSSGFGWCVMQTVRCLLCGRETDSRLFVPWYKAQVLPSVMWLGSGLNCKLHTNVLVLCNPWTAASIADHPSSQSEMALNFFFWPNLFTSLENIRTNMFSISSVFFVH